MRTRPMFDRHRWEQSVLQSGLSLAERSVALVLAHHAGLAGHLPTGGHHRLGRLAFEARVPKDTVRRALSRLQEQGFIERPDIHTWTSRHIWPITLTQPPAAAAAEGEEPPHTSEAAS
ncbi:MarR family transcriptional regulator [Streptomyces galbus]|uniref:MarR family transcriptional regulator n=1 Tax=Streptomyces galbus TaxID=33898 RepID=UPI0037984F17